MHDEAYLKWLDRIGKTRPTQDKHGVDSPENPISDKLEKLQPRNWRLEGNKLIADTAMGPLVQFIPTDLILTGIDENGLPILTKIEV